jgi:hypothetical protein
MACVSVVHWLASGNTVLLLLPPTAPGKNRFDQLVALAGSATAVGLVGPVHLRIARAVVARGAVDSVPRPVELDVAAGDVRGLDRNERR